MCFLLFHTCFLPNNFLNTLHGLPQNRINFSNSSKQTSKKPPPPTFAHNYFFTFLGNVVQIFGQIFGQVFDQIFGQVLDQVFGQGLGEGKNHKYSVRYCRDGKIQCTVPLGRKNLLHRIFSKKKEFTFFSGREQNQELPRSLPQTRTNFFLPEFQLAGTSSKKAPEHFIFNCFSLFFIVFLYFSLFFIIFPYVLLLFMIFNCFSLFFFIFTGVSASGHFLEKSTGTSHRDIWRPCTSPLIQRCLQTKVEAPGNHPGAGTNPVNG